MGTDEPPAAVVGRAPDPPTAVDRGCAHAAAATPHAKNADDAVIWDRRSGPGRPPAPASRSAPGSLIAVLAQVLSLPAVSTVHQSIVCHSVSIYAMHRAGVMEAERQFVQNAETGQDDRYVHFDPSEAYSWPRCPTLR